MTTTTKQLPIATDLTASEFNGLTVNLYDLYRTRVGMGQQTLTGLIFRNCKIEGPAVMLPVKGCHFDAVNFGANGDMRNLVLRPESPTTVIGAIPAADCQFIGTTFFGIGFTGAGSLLDQILAVGSTK